jgi:hypothetical protein
VKPDGEPAFEADVKTSWPQLEMPRVGRVVVVLYGLGDHSKVVVDHSLASQTEAAVRMVESRLGPDQAAAPEQMGFGSVQDMMTAALSDPSGEKRGHLKRSSMWLSD